jgi:IS605 OrfB family transposase
VLATFEAKIKDRSAYPVLDAVADLLSQVERHLFAEQYVRRVPLKDLKRQYLCRFGITARQFNAVKRNLDGKVSSAREAARLRVDTLSAKVRAAKEKVAALEKKLACARKPEARRRLRFKLHQKRRRLQTLRDRLAAARREAARQLPGLCFGTRRLFRAQFYLRENGYTSHEEWLADWRDARSSQFLCLGSKGEAQGNETATLYPDGTLRLRVPPALEHRFGRWVNIPGIRFPHGQDVIDRALAAGQAINLRLVRRKRKGAWVWYVKATTERQDAKIVTSRKNGCLGVDLNPGLVSACLADRHGNPCHARHIPVPILGRTREQVKAALAEAVADIVEWARRAGVPVAVERLDFREKKNRLEALDGARYARMLSSFAYRLFLSLLLSRAAREGVEVILVNPAFTTVIGWVKFGEGYGLSPHAAAAAAIARRALGLRHGERLRSRSRSALPLPARNRGRHVWSDWGRLNRWLRERGGLAAVLSGRRPLRGGRGQGDTPIPGGTRPEGTTSGHGPPGDGLAPAPGWDSPAPIVGKAVRPA